MHLTRTHLRSCTNAPPPVWRRQQLSKGETSPRTRLSRRPIVPVEPIVPVVVGADGTAPPSWAHLPAGALPQTTLP
jgi:hypothetical protein